MQLLCQRTKFVVASIRRQGVSFIYKYKKIKGIATHEQILNRMKMFGFKCWICSKDAYEIDHVIPLRAGGTNWPANLRPICYKCNHQKETK